MKMNGSSGHHLTLSRHARLLQLNSLTREARWKRYAIEMNKHESELKTKKDIDNHTKKKIAAHIIEFSGRLEMWKHKAPEVLYDPECDIRTVTSARRVRFFTNTTDNQALNNLETSSYEDLRSEV